MTTDLYELRLRASQGMHVGSGRGSSYSQETLRFVPGGTLRGALGGTWMRAQHGRTPADVRAHFDDLVVSDAVFVAPGQPWTALAALPLDMASCKYPEEGCPDRHPVTTPACPICHNQPEQSKGERGIPDPDDLPDGVRPPVLRWVNRVALRDDETAEDGALFQREVLDLGGCELVAYVRATPSAAAALAPSDAVLRIGAAKSVVGRYVVTSCEPVADAILHLDAGRHTLRIELLSPGVYVDDFGLPTNAPTERDLRHTLGLGTDAQIGGQRSLTRWGRAFGWNAAVNVPKTEDVTVIAHSVHVVDVTLATAHTLPAIVHNLGLRTDEGCGWARITTKDDHAQP